MLLSLLEELQKMKMENMDIYADIITVKLKLLK